MRACIWYLWNVIIFCTNFNWLYFRQDSYQRQTHKMDAVKHFTCDVCEKSFKLKKIIYLFLENVTNKPYLIYSPNYSRCCSFNCLNYFISFIWRSREMFSFWMWLWPKKECSDSFFYAIFSFGRNFSCFWYWNCTFNTSSFSS